jgi:hypothetical protein
MGSDADLSEGIGSERRSVLKWSVTAFAVADGVRAGGAAHQPLVIRAD